MNRYQIWTTFGLFQFSASVLVAVYWPLHELSSALSTVQPGLWRITGAVLITMAVCLQLGLTGLFLRIVCWSDWQALAGFVLAFSSLGFLGGIGIFDTIVAPHLVANHPGALSMKDPLLRGALGPALIVNGVLLTFGYALLTLAAFRSFYFKSPVVFGFLAGVPLFALGPVLSPGLRIFGGVFWGLGNLFVSYRLWQWRRN